MKISLCSLLEELFQEYEQHHSRMYFVFKKIEKQYTFTDVNQTLLQAVRQQKSDFVGRNLDTAPHLGDEATREKLKNIYLVAWSGKKIFFPWSPNRNMDIFMIIYLEPQYEKENVIQVIGRCASFDKNEFRDKTKYFDGFVALEASPE
ncbi:hypothetical protein COJ60_28915 [Bacillus cereus]|uniref:hypothetical protein n=1 Tax=Bacillus paranthracis TaxID=2026186 RepID=UPI000BF4CB31|nr:hypothetical protein [Bacillus paranthracis]NMW17281.1 hypothetical protein [Bacillus paranthracis]PFN30039.1 hypothetical protein COJ60_28915 [Bacillus cereus]RAT14052.1 hypothetical protein A6E22_00720 [Bacillus cereus]